jgi:protein ImuB
VEKVRGALCLAACDARSAGLGLAPGLTLADARARVPEIAVADHDPAADRRMLGRLAEVCDRYTPLVALYGPDGLMLDITGCGHLFGGEAAMLAGVTDRLGRLGFAARAAIAGAAGTARALARFRSGVVIPEGGEEDAVRALPVAALGVSGRIVTGLARAGLKTIGDLAARPRAVFPARFGAELMDRLDATLGRRHLPVSPLRPVPDLIAERRFAEPVSAEEDIHACLAQLARETCEGLQAGDEGGRIFEASFFRVDGDVRRIPVETARPLREADALARLFAVRLSALADRLDAGFGFDAIRLAVIHAEPRPMTQAALDGSTLEDGDVAALIEQLSARLGPKRVRRFLAVDTHDPDCASGSVPAIAGAFSGVAWTRPEPGTPPARPLFVFDRPQPVETLAEVPDGPPLRFRWRKMLHEVAFAEGPERIAPEWWRQSDDTLTRDYYRVEDSCGLRFWLYREGLYGHAILPRWFLHGLFP